MGNRSTSQRAAMTQNDDHLIRIACGDGMGYIKGTGVAYTAALINGQCRHAQWWATPNPIRTTCPSCNAGTTTSCGLHSPASCAQGRCRQAARSNVHGAPARYATCHLSALHVPSQTTTHTRPVPSPWSVVQTAAQRSSTSTPARSPRRSPTHPTTHTLWSVHAALALAMCVPMPVAPWLCTASNKAAGGLPPA